MKPAIIDQEFILGILRANLDRLYKDFGIERIGLYSSFARNEQTEKSDVDLVYTMIEGRHLSLVNRERLQRLIRQQIRRKPDLINQRYMNPFTNYTMLKEVVYV